MLNAIFVFNLYPTASLHTRLPFNERSCRVQEAFTNAMWVVRWKEAAATFESTAFRIYNPAFAFQSHSDVIWCRENVRLKAILQPHLYYSFRHALAAVDFSQRQWSCHLAAILLFGAVGLNGSLQSCHAGML